MQIAKSKPEIIEIANSIEPTKIDTEIPIVVTGNAQVRIQHEAPLVVEPVVEVYANRGPYGLAFRSNYMRVEDENSRSGLLDTRINSTLDMGVNDFVASFRVHDKVRLVTGVRHVLAKMELDIYSTLGDREVLNESIVVADDNKFDFVVGINFNHWFNDKWGLMLNSDLGVAGDNDRDFSVDFRGLYRISDLNNFWFGFRYLQIGSDTTLDDITYKVDMTQIGPTVGWAFTF